MSQWMLSSPGGKTFPLTFRAFSLNCLYEIYTSKWSQILKKGCNINSNSIMEFSQHEGGILKDLTSIRKENLN